ncbi:hypothetical protein [Desulfovibrio sp. QI0442]
MTDFHYSCGGLACENKGPSGPRVDRLCPICNSYYQTAAMGLGRRESLLNHGAASWRAAYAAVDALGAVDEDRHAVYLAFRVLHHVTAAQYGRTYGAVVKHFGGLLTVLPQLTPHTLYLEKEWERIRKCRQWCGAKRDHADCASSCSLAAMYLLDLRRIGGEPALEQVRSLVDAFSGMSGLNRCKAFSVMDDILGLDPMACAGLGQAVQKSASGLEISLRSRLDRRIAADARLRNTACRQAVQPPLTQTQGAFHE